jgi:hypothetical protein
MIGTAKERAVAELSSKIHILTRGCGNKGLAGVRSRFPTCQIA